MEIDIDIVEQPLSISISISIMKIDIVEQALKQNFPLGRPNFFSPTAFTEFVKLQNVS
jgi:hypothetical protein